MYRCLHNIPIIKRIFYILCKIYLRHKYRGKWLSKSVIRCSVEVNVFLVILLYFFRYFLLPIELNVFTQHFANDRLSIFLSFLLLLFRIRGQNANPENKIFETEKNCCTCNRNQTANGILAIAFRWLGTINRTQTRKTTKYSRNVMAKNSRR